LRMGVLFRLAEMRKNQGEFVKMPFDGLPKSRSEDETRHTPTVSPGVQDRIIFDYSADAINAVRILHKFRSIIKK